MPTHVPEFSVILPVYNEEGNVGPLISEIRNALTPLGKPFEILAVDDCSRDGSLGALRRLQPTHPELRIVRHRLNSGQSAAFASGMRRARGNIFITLDADGQNDPADLPRLIAALTEGVSAVVGVRARREDSTLRRLSSRVANGYRDWITGVRVRDAGCFLRVLRREAALELPVFNGLHRFVVTLLRYQGHAVAEIEVNHRPRLTGQSKYGIGNRLWRGIRDCFAMRWYRRRAIPGNRLLPEEAPDA
jgi:glycosyltransferase involved in cell wall biosynthesis